MGDVVSIPLYKYHATVTNRRGSMSLCTVRAGSEEAALSYFKREYPNAEKIEINVDRNEGEDNESKD